MRLGNLTSVTDTDCLRSCLASDSIRCYFAVCDYNVKIGSKAGKQRAFSTAQVQGVSMHRDVRMAKILNQQKIFHSSHCSEYCLTEL